jgi:phage terminase large subunit
MPSSPTRKKTAKVRDLIMDPTLFAETMLGHDLWPKQQEILRSVATFPRTAVKACHSSGKTLTAADAVLWWITHQQEATAVTTAPTWTQVERVLWGEIRSAASGARIKYPKASANLIRLGPNRYAIGLATNEGVRFQGFHGNVLVVLDEAPGILPEIWEAIEGIRAGGNVRVLALGNPTISSGPFYDAFTSNRESWSLITISAFDTPNLQGITMDSLSKLSEDELDQNVRPYLTTRRWVKEKLVEWGAGHPLWESRVLGNFPQESDDALFSLSWLEQAKLREDGDGELCAGVDVAGPGDNETALCIRRGPKIVLLRAWVSKDPTGDLLAALQPYKAELTKVNVDTVGIGYYFARHLKDQGLIVNPINVGESSREPERYANLKAEYFWALRMRAQSGELSGLADDRTIAQLASIRYQHNARGQIVIESKDEARKRGVKSPDRAEAVMLAFIERGQIYYPYLEFLKRQQMQVMNKQPTRMERCPNCGADTCIIQIPGAGFKCNRCGHQVMSAPESRVLSRRDVIFRDRFG